jgi:formylglycine-generating enzyme
MILRPPPMLVLAAAVAACTNSPVQLGQLVLHVDTDAPIPLGPGVIASGDEPPPLFDRIRFDLIRPGESRCDVGCSRDFEVSHAALGQGPLSIGIVPVPDRLGYRVRVRLYRDAFKQGEPLDGTTLDANVALPPAPAEGILDVSLLLETERFGQPQGSLEAPVAPGVGRPRETRAGTWPGARRVQCSAPAGKGEQCVPGGALWMGHPLVPGGTLRDDEPAPRLVVLSPFYLDETEVTVGDFRRWLLEREEGANGDPVSPPGRAFPIWVEDFCTFPEDLLDDSRDELALNCLSYDRALEYCRTRDPLLPAELPTEAQLEHAAGALSSHPYVWGRDDPACGDAVHALGGAGVSFDSYPAVCRPMESSGGPQPAGTGHRDALPLGGGRITDLAGNVSELARDAWSPQLGGFWTQTLLRDPVCKVTTAASRRVVKGGHWGSDGHELQAAFRRDAMDRFAPSHTVDTKLGPTVGFRCARNAISAE